MSVTLTQADFKRLKTRLTYRQNRLKKARGGKDQAAIIAEASQIISECDYAIGIFEQKSYPDDHHRWTRAKDDAQLIKSRAERGLV